MGQCLLIKTSIGPHLRVQDIPGQHTSDNSQYCRPQTYSGALKYSFFPKWNSLAPSVVPEKVYFYFDNHAKVLHLEDESVE